MLQPAALKDPAFLEALAALRADLGVVAAYGKILTERSSPCRASGMINVHASLLPRYRGAAPVHRAVIAGERETGVTIMRVVKALDAGPMLATRARPIGPDETSDDVERDLARARRRTCCVATVDASPRAAVEEMPQDDARATYAHRMTKDDGVDRLDAAGDAVHNQIRGLHPWPHAFTFLGGQRLILLRSTSRSADPRRPGGRHRPRRRTAIACASRPATARCSPRDSG